MRVEERTEIVKRLRSAEGHLHAIVGMVEDEQPCEQILHQIHAVQSAIQAANRLIVRRQVEHSLEILRSNPCPEESSLELRRLIDLYNLRLTFS